MSTKKIKPVQAWAVIEKNGWRTSPIHGGVRIYGSKAFASDLARIDGGNVIHVEIRPLPNRTTRSVGGRPKGAFGAARAKKRRAQRRRAKR